MNALKGFVGNAEKGLDWLTKLDLDEQQLKEEHAKRASKHENAFSKDYSESLQGVGREELINIVSVTRQQVATWYDKFTKCEEDKEHYRLKCRETRRKLDALEAAQQKRTEECVEQRVDDLKVEVDVLQGKLCATEQLLWDKQEELSEVKQQYGAQLEGMLEQHQQTLEMEREHAHKRIDELRVQLDVNIRKVQNLEAMQQSQEGGSSKGGEEQLKTAYGLLSDTEQKLAAAQGELTGLSRELGNVRAKWQLDKAARNTDAEEIKAKTDFIAKLESQLRDRSNDTSKEILQHQVNRLNEELRTIESKYMSMLEGARKEHAELKHKYQAAVADLATLKTNPISAPKKETSHSFGSSYLPSVVQHVFSNIPQGGYFVIVLFLTLALWTHVSPGNSRPTVELCKNAFRLQQPLHPRVVPTSTTQHPKPQVQPHPVTQVEQGGGDRQQQQQANPTGTTAQQGEQQVPVRPTAALRGAHTGAAGSSNNAAA